MANRPWALDLNAVSKRPVSRAGLLLSWVSKKMILLDADGGGFAELAETPGHLIDHPLALSPDGTAVIYSSVEDNGRTMFLTLQLLGAGSYRRIPAPPGCFDFLAAISHDGQTIATLSQDADYGFVDLIDIPTGARRRLWSCDGGASEHGTSISWSPDGHLIAATYYHAPTDELATAVIGAETGTVIADHEYRAALGCPNGTWVDNHRVVIIDDLSEEKAPAPLYLLDVYSGSTRRLSRPPQWKYYLALLDGHFLARARDANLYPTPGT